MLDILNYKSTDDLEFSSAKNLRIAQDYLFIKDDNPQSQRFCVITIYAYTSKAGKGFRGSTAIIRRGYLRDKNLIKHDGLYNVSCDADKFEYIKSIASESGQYISTRGGRQKRNFELNEVVFSTHKKVIDSLRDTNWWLAAYAKRKKSETLWSTNLQALWRVPNNEKGSVKHLGVERALAKQKEHEEFGWLDESVPVIETGGETHGA